jgi:hypothetical protein
MGNGRFDGVDITAAGISGFQTVNTENVKADSITLTNGSDTLSVKKHLAVTGAIDFGSGKKDELILKENATVSAGSIETVGAFSITIDLGEAYKGDAAVTVGANGVFASADLVLNLDLANATLGETNLLVSGIDTFAGTLVYGNGSYVLGDTIKLEGKGFEITITDEGLALVGGEVAAGVRNDIDGNGFSDLIMYKTDEFFSGAWLTQNSSGAVAWSGLADPAEVSLLGLGTALKDGAAVKALFHADADKNVSFWTIEEGTVTGYESVTQINAATEILGLGDFNNDGLSDLLLQSADGVLGVHLTDGTGWKEIRGLGSEWDIVGISDLNNDGISDIIMKHEAGFSGAWLVQEDQDVVWGDLGTLESGMDIVGTGDFNGDGSNDILISNGSWVGAWILKEGKMDGFISVTDNLNGSIEDIGDFNGDGVDDIRLRTDDGMLGYLSVSADGSSSWTQLGENGLGDEWSTKFSAIC